jgi:hypothetical protein
MHKIIGLDAKHTPRYALLTIPLNLPNIYICECGRWIRFVCQLVIQRRPIAGGFGYSVQTKNGAAIVSTIN